jgi:Leucine-rich repeat (LRR) protein
MIRSENKAPFIEAHCSSVEKLFFGEDFHLGLTSIDSDALKNFTNLKFLDVSENLIG